MRVFFLFQSFVLNQTRCCFYSDKLQTMHQQLLANGTDRDLFEDHVVKCMQRYGPNHERTVLAQMSLGACKLQQGEHAAARIELEAAAAASEAALGLCHEHTLSAWEALGALHMQLGDYGSAARWFEQVASGRLAEVGAGHWRTLNAQAGLAQCLLRAGRADEAVALLEVAAPGLEAQLGPMHPAVGYAQQSLGVARQQQQQQQQRRRQHASEAGASGAAREADVDELASWGFDRDAVRGALEAANGDKQAAANMLLG
eukprot:COSAG06_NODE_98_length_24155_cov_29.681784_3_plen_258_part_00